MPYSLLLSVNLHLAFNRHSIKQFNPLPPFQLALIQTKHVIGRLQKLYPKQKFEIRKWKSGLINIGAPAGRGIGNSWSANWKGVGSAYIHTCKQRSHAAQRPLETLREAWLVGISAEAMLISRSDSGHSKCCDCLNGIAYDRLYAYRLL